MRIIQDERSLNDILGISLEWRLDVSPCGNFIQIINSDGMLVGAVNKELVKVAHLLITAPKLVDALSRCVIVLTNPELYPEIGEITVAYAASVLRQSINSTH